jgi:hypothetical protein
MTFERLQFTSNLGAGPPLPLGVAIITTPAAPPRRGFRRVGYTVILLRFFHSTDVTSNLASTILISNHGRYRNALLQSKSSRAKSFVSRILTSKFFDMRILRGISC